MGERNPNEYIHNLARTLMGTLSVRGVDWKDHKMWPAAAREYAIAWCNREQAFIYTTYRRTLARALDFRYGEDVLSFVVQQKKGTRGFIACCGLPWKEQNTQTSIYDVIQDQKFTIDKGGEYIVTKLARYAIVAAMTDNLIADIQKFDTTLEGV